MIATGESGQNRKMRRRNQKTGVEIEGEKNLEWKEA